MRSTFQFSDPKLLNISFRLNQNFKPVKNAQIEIPVVTEVETSEGPEKNSAFVVLRVEIGSDDDKTPFIVNAEEGAMFKWEEDEISGVSHEQLLNQNAPALLLSYLRPTIAMITAASPFTAYNIPFMNFMNCCKDKME